MDEERVSSKLEWEENDDPQIKIPLLANQFPLNSPASLLIMEMCYKVSTSRRVILMYPYITNLK